MVIVKQRILWVRIAVIVGLMFSLGTGCSTSPQEPRISETIPRPLTAIQAYPIAQYRARQWRENAYLGEVIILIPGNEVEVGPHAITFYFIANQALGPLRWWDSAFIKVDAYTGKIIEFDKYKWATSPQGKFSPFDIESIVLDSSDALRLAEELGGKDYRGQHPNARVRIESDGSGAGNMFWIIGYFRPPEVLSDEWSVRINADTGEVRGDASRPPAPSQ